MDAQGFATALSLQYFPISNPRFSGFALQYGSRISFVAKGIVYGFVSGETFSMVPLVEEVDGDILSHLCLILDSKAEKAIPRIPVFAGKGVPHS